MCMQKKGNSKNFGFLTTSSFDTTKIAVALAQRICHMKVRISQCKLRLWLSMAKASLYIT